MSNPEQKFAAATARWEACQLQGASAQRELDYAVAVFEKDKGELPAEQVEAIMAQIEVQRQTIKDFLLKSYAVFADAEKAYAYAMSKPKLIIPGA